MNLATSENIQSGFATQTFKFTDCWTQTLQNKSWYIQNKSESSRSVLGAKLVAAMTKSFS